MKNALITIATLLATTTTFAAFTQNPTAPKQETVTTYSCENGSILLSIRGNAVMGRYSLKLNNAELSGESGLTGTSEAADCFKTEKKEMNVVIVPSCRVLAPSGNTYTLEFTGYAGEINSVKIAAINGQSLGPGPSASCVILK